MKCPICNILDPKEEFYTIEGVQHPEYGVALFHTKCEVGFYLNSWLNGEYEEEERDGNNTGNASKRSNYTNSSNLH